MNIKLIAVMLAFSTFSITTSWADTPDNGAPLISDAANAGTMVVVGGEAFYDPDQGVAFDAAPSDYFSSGVGAVPEISYTPEGYMVSAETISGVRYETVTDQAGRIIEARQTAPFQ